MTKGALFDFYIDDNDRRRCLACDAYAAADALVCKRCARRASKPERKEICFTGSESSQWRKYTLARYVARVLALPNGEPRRVFFDANPIRDIFK